MRHRSKKTAAIYRKWTPIRNRYLEETGCCDSCGCFRDIAVHEILSGSMRMAAFVERACWLRLCWRENSDDFTDRSKWPFERQVALKLRVDPHGFDLSVINRILQPRRIHAEDVASFGCVHHPKVVDLRGRRFSFLVPVYSVKNGKRTSWRCICDCGRATDVSYPNLVSGDTKSCGCQWKAAHTKHGCAGNGSRAYSSWSNMRQRCLNPNYRDYRLWGGRGISVCQRWIDGFENFLADMGEPPEGMTLGRIDNDGDYEPSNCRWETITEQARNTRGNNRLTLDGETLLVTEWAERAVVANRTFFHRLARGWSLADALRVPAITKGGRTSRVG